jgi:hypothetical protein
MLKLETILRVIIVIQLQHLAPRVISQITSEIRISCVIWLMLVGADQGAFSFCYSKADK